MADQRESLRDQIIAYLAEKGWPWRQEGRWIRLRQCPACRADETYTFALDQETGAGKCHRGSCGYVGGLTLIALMHGDAINPPSNSRSAPRSTAGAIVADDALWRDPHDALLADPSILASYCAQRAMSPETVRRCRIGVRRDQGVTTIPYFDRDGKFLYVKLKSRGVDGTKRIRRQPVGATSVLWGLDRLDGIDQVIVTEGEEDAAVLIDAGLANVVSVPDGAALSADSRGAKRWIDALEPFRDIVICFDGDVAGQKGAGVLATMLGVDRCRIVELPDDVVCNGKPAKDPTDFARAGAIAQVLSAIEKAHAPAHPLVGHIASDEAIDAIWAQWYDTDPHGISTGWGALDNLIGGVRPGEVTILTGHTGSGKSAFAVGLATQVAQSGRAVLFASLELSQEDLTWRFLQRIIGKFPWARRDQSNAHVMTKPDLERGIEILRSLPLHVVKRFGTMDIKDFLDCARFATRRYGAALHVLDHLHFATMGSGDNERHVLSDAIYATKNAARDLRTSFVVIAHPSRHARNKESPDISDLHGAAALEQVADNVLVVRRIENAALDAPNAEVSLKKLRQGRSGQKGSALFDFEVAGERFVDPTTPIQIVALTWQEEEEKAKDDFYR